ncbi:MAG TPA: asparagine synthase-related protein [Acidimicrobiales bacterium]|nr:asparagine synthase-related protein [Acidimicrobiales bacterium]
MDDPYALSPLDLVSGSPIGLVPGPAVPGAIAGATPLSCFESAVLSALRRPPCVVSFSGGRDSSAVLAVATSVARKEGLPLPIPVTHRFPGAPETDETDWQETVVRHLGLDDWSRVDFDDELDLVGPIAQKVLGRHGVLWPANSHFHVPVLDACKGGSVLTGIDGDGLLASWRWARAAAVLAGRARPIPRDVVRLGLALSPRPIRAVGLLMDGKGPPLPWLRAPAARAVNRAWAASGSAEPLRWDRRVRWWARLRGLRLTIHSFDLLARDAGALAVHPLADDRFLAAMASDGGRFGIGDRTAWMERLFGDALPEAILRRRTKAPFNAAFWTEHSRSFARSWHGGGVDPGLVDHAALRREWLDEQPDARSSLLIQSAWLAETAAGAPTSRHREVEQPVDGNR